MSLFFTTETCSPAPQLGKDAHAHTFQREPSVLQVVLAWKRSVCVLCSNAMGELSASTDALHHCLQNLIGVRPSVLCSSACAGAGAVVLCSSYWESKQATSIFNGRPLHCRATSWSYAADHPLVDSKCSGWA